MSSYAKVLKVPQQAGRAVVSSEDAQVSALSWAIKESLKREIIEEISPLSDVALMPYGGGAAEIRRHMATRAARKRRKLRDRLDQHEKI